MAVATPGAPNDECGPGPGTLLLTEVDVAMPDRVELHNPGADAVDLEGWFIYWVTPTEDGYTELPSFTLDPGAYVYMVDDVPNPMTPAYVDGQGVIHIQNINWAEDEAGACYLFSPLGSVGVDFVRWGSADFVPALPDTWEDTPDLLSPIPTGSTLGRSSLTDTNTAADWCLMPATLGDANNPCN